MRNIAIVEDNDSSAKIIEEHIIKIIKIRYLIGGQHG